MIRARTAGTLLTAQGRTQGRVSANEARQRADGVVKRSVAARSETEGARRGCPLGNDGHKGAKTDQGRFTADHADGRGWQTAAPLADRTSALDSNSTNTVLLSDIGCTCLNASSGQTENLMPTTSLIPVPEIQQRIPVIRGKRVMLDADLARLYGVTTFNLNKAVSRSLDCFPKDFSIIPTRKEVKDLIFQSGISTPDPTPSRT